MKLGPKEKYCRRFGIKMMWNDRCSSSKCGLIRRKYRPGAHGHKSRTLSAICKTTFRETEIKVLLFN
jgi:hypothetical protein